MKDVIWKDRASRLQIGCLLAFTLLASASASAQQTYTISTVAGGGQNYPGNGGPATSAGLYSTDGIVEDNSGNIYFAEYGRNVIRKVTPNGIISTTAGIYGAFSGGFSGDGGPAINAQLSSPSGLALDASGNLYVADTANGRIRKISTTGIITTVAGGGTLGGGNIGDGGPATEAILDNPHGIAFDSSGNLYVAANQRVRKVDGKGIITTVVGGGSGPGIGDGGPATNAQLSNPSGIAFDPVGNLYIADWSHTRIRKVSTDGIISTFAGTGNTGYSGDGGPATNAELFAPWGVATDSFGNVYITDYGNHVVRAVSANGIINTIAGGGPCCTVYDGEPAIGAYLTYPEGITVGAGGKLYFASTGQSRIFRLTPGPLTATSTSLASDANPQNLGTKVTFAAGVEPLSGSGTPTGSITFTVDGTSVAVVPLDNTGHASYATSSLPAGTHTIAAAYSGDATYSTSGATLIEAIFIKVSVTFGTAPSGLAYAVDGVTYSLPQTLSLNSGSQHRISVVSPQISNGTQNAFSSWSDGGAQTQVITIPLAASDSYTANFKTAYLLTTVASPVSGGSVAPASGNYYPVGASVALVATPISGYAFSRWTGSVASANSASTNITNDRSTNRHSLVRSFRRDVAIWQHHRESWPQQRPCLEHSNQQQRTFGWSCHPD